MIEMRSEYKNLQSEGPGFSIRFSDNRSLALY